MVISPNDFSLWARLTGNKYPSTPAERAKKGPEVHNFIQNLDKEGMLGGKEPEEPKKERSLGEKIATGALIAGGVAAAVAAGRDPRVQNVARRAGSTAKDKVGDFLRNIGGPRVIDRDVVDASYDITPNPKEQQSSAPYWNTPAGKEELLENEAQSAFMNSPEGRAMAKKEVALRATGEDYNYLPQIENWKNTYKAQKAAGVMNEEALASTIDLDKTKPVAIDRFTPLSEGKTSFTEGAISKEDPYGDISNLGQRVDRTYGKFLSNLKPEDAAKTKESLIRGAGRERDYALGYMNARARGRTDEQAAITGRKFAGYDLSPAVKPQTPFREALSELKIASTVPAKIDELLNLVETGPQIILPEKAQKMNDGSSAIVLAGGGNNTNVIPTMGATIGGSSLTDKHATKMAVDNALDNVRAELTGTPVPITGVTSTGLKTFVQDDNLRRIAPTPEQAQAIREEPGRVSRTFDEMTGFTAPKSETISTNPLEERISRLEGKTAELRAIQENLGRAGELMSAGLDPRTTRFDSARAAGLTSKSGIKPRITNPRFQENMNLGKVQEAAIPESSGRVFFEQDSEGRVIPETVERRSERKVVRGPDTKTRGIAGGYIGTEGQQQGSSIGPYGVEPVDFPQADITKKPTEISLPKTARDKRGMSDLSNQAVIKLAESGSRGTRQKAIEEMGSRNPSAKLLAGGKAIMGSGATSDPTKADASASFDAAREIRKIQTTGNPATANERVGKFLDDLKKLQGG